MPTTLYTLLGVTKDATATQLAQAYRTAVKYHHPDRGGSDRMFKDVVAAYHLLRDPVARLHYDQQHAHHLATDVRAVLHPLFSLFQPLPTPTPPTPPLPPVVLARTPDRMIPLSVTLEDLYWGRERKLRVVGASRCVDCPAPKHTSPLTPCTHCAGQGTILQAKLMSVMIHKGMVDTQRLVFREEADQAIDKLPGDIIIELACVPHATYRRQGHDLYSVDTLTVAEALVGFQRTLTGIDGHELYLTRSHGITTPQQVFKLEGRGMPLLDEPYCRGHLYLSYTIDYPRELTADQRVLLLQAFPATVDAPPPCGAVSLELVAS
jgi:DnaJ-class molecular chaperone